MIRTDKRSKLGNHFYSISPLGHMKDTLRISRTENLIIHAVKIRLSF